MFFVGKDLAKQETLKVVREKSGQVGEDAAKLGANIAEALKAAKPSASEGVAGLSKEMTQELQAMLKGNDAELEGIALIEKAIPHLKEKITAQQTGFEGQLRTALEASGLESADLANKDLAGLLAKITELQKATPIGIDAEVTRLYGTIVGGTETEVAKQLEAIGKHQDTAPELQAQLKQALLAGGVNQAEIDVCGDDFGALSKLVETKMQESKVAPLNSEVLERVEVLINDAYAKTGEEGANTLEEKVSALLELVESQQEFIRMYNGMMETFQAQLNKPQQVDMGEEALATNRNSIEWDSTLRELEVELGVEKNVQIKPFAHAESSSGEIMNQLKGLIPLSDLPFSNLEPFMEGLSSPALIEALKGNNPNPTFIDDINKHMNQVFYALQGALSNMEGQLGDEIVNNINTSEKMANHLDKLLNKQLSPREILADNIRSLRDNIDFLSKYYNGNDVENEFFPIRVKEKAKALEVARQTGKQPQDVQIVALEQVIPFLKQEFEAIQKDFKAEMNLT